MRGLWVAAGLALAGCSEHGASPAADAGTDAAALADAAKPCPDDQTFVSGELVDLDSSEAARAPVGGAQIGTTATAPDGSFGLCVTSTQLAIPYAHAGYLAGQIVLDDQAVHGLYPLSLRLITAERAASFYTSLGLTFDPARAQVLVFQAGDAVDLALDRPHGLAHSAQRDTDAPATLSWSDGASGQYVLFPNVDVTEPTGTLDGMLQLSVPLEAGKLTIASTFWVWL